MEEKTSGGVFLPKPPEKPPPPELRSTSLISEYRYYRYFCQSIDTLSIPIFFNTSHHYDKVLRLWEKRDF